MYNFKSITDPQQAIVGEGQILVQNIAGRTFRVGTPGFLVSPFGYAVVDAADPIVQHNLKNKRISEKSISASVPAAPSAPSKKAKKKKSVESDNEETAKVDALEVPETQEVQSVEASFSEESVQIVEEIVAQSETEENIRSEEEGLTPKSDSSSL